jgi:hypothetical protein
MFVDPTKFYPGPGAYKGAEACENKGGHYIVSRYKSPGCAVISRGGPRFDHGDLRRSTEIPGPGNYNASYKMK